MLLFAAFIFGNGGASAFRDDVDAILAAPRSGDLGELSFADDGSAVVRLYKNDLYLLADESGVLPGLRQQLRERFGDLGFGIRLNDGKMRVCISKRVLGLVPVSMQVEASVSWDGAAVVIHAESVLLGSRTALPESLWPDSVREDFRVDLAQTGRAQQIADGIMEVGRGVTFLHGQGAFTRKERNVVFVVVKLTQVSKIKLIAHAVDPHAFMIIMSANEVMGRGFSEPGIAFRRFINKDKVQLEHPEHLKWHDER